MTNGSHDQTVRPVDTLVLKPITGVGAWQGAQHQHPRHEAKIGFRFSGSHKLVHLVGLGEVVQRLGRGFADRLDRRAFIVSRWLPCQGPQSS